MGDPPRPGPIDAFKSSYNDLETFLNVRPNGTIGVEFASWNVMMVHNNITTFCQEIIYKIYLISNNKFPIHINIYAHVYIIGYDNIYMFLTFILKSSAI